MLCFTCLFVDAAHTPPVLEILTTWRAAECTATKLPRLSTSQQLERSIQCAFHSYLLDHRPSKSTPDSIAAAGVPQLWILSLS